MSFITRIIGSTESLAEEIEVDDEAVKKLWEDYFDTVPEKKKCIDSMTNESITQLQNLLKQDLVDIEGEEKTDDEIIRDLEVVEHDEKIERIKRLEICLGYAETEYQHCFSLLCHLHDILKAELHLVKQYLKGSERKEELQMHLRKQLHLETEVISAIRKQDSFHRLFLDLLKGEHEITAMDDHEKELIASLKKKLGSFFLGDVAKSIVAEWALLVFRSVEDAKHDVIAKDMLLHYKWDLNHDVVNSDEFPKLVTTKMVEIIPQEHSERFVTTFVEVFRHWYNEHLSAA